MTRTGPADVVMSACDLIAPGPLARPGSREPGFGWPAHRESAFARAVFPASTTGKPAHYRLAGRSGRLPLYGWSSDPGRDMLCIFISPPRWLQWP